MHPKIVMPWKTGTKSFGYHGINFQKKNLHKLIHLIYSYQYLLLCIRSVYLCKQVHKQAIKTNKMKINNDVDSTDTQYSISFQALTNYHKSLKPPQPHFILSTTLTLISATDLIYMTDLCLSTKLR